MKTKLILLLALLMMAPMANADLIANSNVENRRKKKRKKHRTSSHQSWRAAKTGKTCKFKL